MDYQEKLIWGQFLPIAVGCLIYAVDAARQMRGGTAWPITGVLLLIVVVQVVYLSVVAAVSRPEPRDERTRLIEYKGFKTAYLLMMALMFVWVWAAMTRAGWLDRVMREPVLLVLVWFGVEAVRTGTQIALYRRPVQA